MVGRLQAAFSLLLGLSLFVGGAATIDCVRKGRTENFVILKITDGCRSTSTTLVLARESLEFGIQTNGDVHAAEITFKFGSSCSVTAGVQPTFALDTNPVLGFDGQTFPFDVVGALNSSALVFRSYWKDEPKKDISCSNPGVLLVLGGIAAGVFACRHFKWLCWSGRGKTAPVAQPAVKTAGSHRSQRAAKAAATPAPLLPTPTPTTITPLSRGLTVRDEPPPATVGGKKKAEPSTITHSIGLTCHDDPPPRRPLGPPSKPKKTAEGCGTKTADAFGLHVHDEAPPKTPKRPKSAGLTVHDKSQPTKTEWTGATVVSEGPSKESDPSAPSGPSAGK
ncbi:hypothetical protein M3Y99_00569200 [Aphelenchoides fujianensis]|nr:hypothetical protein M3Y99_00569200 [Aphelenchoides fujianensis]